MTKLTYRGNRYVKEANTKTSHDWWVVAHNPIVRLMYRGHDYRPCENNAEAATHFSKN